MQTEFNHTTVTAFFFRSYISLSSLDFFFQSILLCTNHSIPFHLFCIPFLLWDSFELHCIAQFIASYLFITINIIMMMNVTAVASRTGFFLFICFNQRHIGVRHNVGWCWTFGCWRSKVNYFVPLERNRRERIVHHGSSLRMTGQVFSTKYHIVKLSDCQNCRNCQNVKKSRNETNVK